MKSLTTFAALPALTANTENAAFPVANVTDLDPRKRWIATQYAADEFVKCDFGSAKVLTAIFLNQCNFLVARIQGNATDSWATPSFDLSVSLVVDQLGNRKGWFDLTAFNYRWLRILIEDGQTLDNAESYPAIGNVICGSSVSLPLASTFSPKINQTFFRFEPDSGGLIKTPRGYKRQEIVISCGDTLDNIRALSKTWNMGVFFADVGNAQDSWLVYPPDDWKPGIRSTLDADISFTVEERP